MARTCSYREHAIACAANAMLPDVEAEARARVGTMVDTRYRLERLLGTGGMAAVYEAVHRNGHRVAIKILHRCLATDDDVCARFLREGYAANRVEHAGAVRVLDDARAADGSVFLVMDLLRGQTVQARWQQLGKRLPANEAQTLGLALLDVLAAAHRSGVVHRDIKPDNLFITRDGSLKVLDFGIAKLRDAGSIAATRTGRMMGTPAFMAPEQALGRGHDVDAQTDLWAVGATLFFLLSGTYVHPAQTVEEMFVYAGSRPARPLQTVAPWVPVDLASVVDRALAFAKKDRWPNAESMAAALRATRGADIVPKTVPGQPAAVAAWLTAPSNGPAATPVVADPATTTGGTAARLPDRTARDTRSFRFAWLGGACALIAVGAAIALPSRRIETVDRVPPVLSVAAPGAAASSGPQGDPPRPTEEPKDTASAGLSAPLPSSAASVLPTPTPNAPATPRSDALARGAAARAAPAAVTTHPTASASAPNAEPQASICDTVPFFVDDAGIQRIRPECR